MYCRCTEKKKLWIKQQSFAKSLKLIQALFCFQQVWLLSAAAAHFGINFLHSGGLPSLSLPPDKQQFVSTREIRNFGTRDAEVKVACI